MYIIGTHHLKLNYPLLFFKYSQRINYDRIIRRKFILLLNYVSTFNGNITLNLKATKVILLTDKYFLNV